MIKPRVAFVNLPNILTVIRIAMTFVFVFFLFKGDYHGNLAAALIFALAAFTDWLDGYWARKYNLISNFGKLADPIADKFLTLAAFGAFSYLKIIPVWMVALIALREIYLTILRFKASAQGKVLAAETLGKYKTVIQMAAIILILVYLVLYAKCPSSPEYWTMIIDVTMYLTVGITLVSGFTNLRNNREAYFG